MENLKELYIESADYLNVNDRESLVVKERAISEAEVFKLEKSILSLERIGKIKK